MGADAEAEEDVDAEKQQPLKPTLKRQRAEREGPGARPNVQVQISSPTRGAALAEGQQATSRPGSAATHTASESSDDQQSLGRDTSSIYSADDTSSQTSSRGAAAAVPLDTFYYKRMRRRRLSVYCFRAHSAPKVLSLARLDAYTRRYFHIKLILILRSGAGDE